ncbi:MAG: hypothetical protein JNM46_00310 [Anaerolineales bacterium]|nr:hypothetical protein [Anaerolineales bacterium]
MSAENQESDSIDIEEVVLRAKEIMLRDGMHVPALIMDADPQIIVGEIKKLPDADEDKLNLFRSIGLKLAKHGTIQRLRQVFMVSEAWYSMPNNESDENLRPSEDPNRKEVLIIVGVAVNENKKFMKILEILRDTDKKVISLEAINEVVAMENKLAIETPFLDALVDGYQNAFRARYN